MKYKICFSEYLHYFCKEINAENYDEAKNKAWEMFNNGEILVNKSEPDLRIIEYYKSPVCPNCNSKNIIVDSVSYFNEKIGEWITKDTSPKPWWCNNDNCDIEEFNNPKWEYRL